MTKPMGMIELQIHRQTTHSSGMRGCSYWISFSATPAGSALGRYARPTKLRG
jgi:hypothetical protein